MDNILFQAYKKRNVFDKYTKFNLLNIKAVDDENSVTNFASMELNSIFKMIRIKYEGSIKIQNIYPSIFIKQTPGRITLINFKQIDLQDNVLFRYTGNMIIRKCAVYGWGQNSVLATIENNNSDIIKNDDNTFENHNDLIQKKTFKNKQKTKEEKMKDKKLKTLKSQFLNLTRSI